MNVTVERGLLLGIGGLIGAGITYFVMKNKNSKEIEEVYREISDEDAAKSDRINELEGILDIRSANDLKEGEKTDGIELKNSSKSEKLTAINKFSQKSEKNGNCYSSFIGKLKDTGRISYSSLSKKASQELDEATMDEEEAVMAGYEFPKDDDILRSQVKPQLITRDQYANECLYYAKEELLYYPVDDTLAREENDEIFDDISGTVGDEALKSFGYMDEDEPDVCYVRNDLLAIDYSIQRLNHMSYHVGVLGMDDDIPEDSEGKSPIGV
jgi:hypothetical protein